jgi:hypothetical protein
MHSTHKTRTGTFQADSNVLKKPRSCDGSAQKQLPGVVLRPEQDSFEIAEHTGALKIIKRDDIG